MFLYFITTQLIFMILTNIFLIFQHIPILIVSPCDENRSVHTSLQNSITLANVKSPDTFLKSKGEDILIH